ncbi:MAG TPA: class I adenylate-forming enzyme family protein [Ignavibacteria bacterium]|nr:class I adenylate-forming enzyme family protein [Ignavibacteria bacterium]
MHLYEETKGKIFKAHYVRGIFPTNYQVLYKNIFELLQYRAHAEQDNIFITFYSETGEKTNLTYSEFIKKVFQTANYLKNLGIEPEDRIATVSHNHVYTVIQYFAAWCLGATVVPLNVNEEPERIKYILKSSVTKLAFVNHEYYDMMLMVMGNMKLNLILHDVKNKTKFIEGIPVFEDEISRQPGEFTPNPIVNRQTEALIVYTSGTTGLPKGVVLTQYNLMIDADGIAKWHKLEHGEAMMCVLPIHHVNGTIVTLMTPMYYGGRIVLNQKFHTNYFFKRLREEKVHVVSVVPTLLQFLWHDYENEPARGAMESYLPDFRHIICGAGPLTCELASKFEEMFKLRIVHGYGLSETTCYSCFIPVDLPADEHKRWQNEFGFPAIGIEIEPNEMDIQNDKGESVHEGERGEIVIRGHNVMKYYDSNPEANAKTFEFNWFRSGDEGFFKFDAKRRKYFFITGRIKELIIRGGVNIAPLEIDEVIMSIPEVKAGIAVGFDNDWYGEEVGALILLKEGIKQSESIKSEIISKCLERLPFYKTPKIIIFSDFIPVTSTGKYQRNKVKHLFEEYKTFQFKGK